MNERTCERPRRTSYTPYKRKSIVNESLVPSLSAFRFFFFLLSHVVQEHIDQPDTSPTVAGTRLKSRRVARSTRFVRFRVPFAPPSFLMNRTDTTVRLKHDRPIHSEEWDTSVRRDGARMLFGQWNSYRVITRAFANTFARR